MIGDPPFVDKDDAEALMFANKRLAFRGNYTSFPPNSSIPSLVNLAYSFVSCSVGMLER